MSKNKGSSYERLIANKLKAIWPDAKRGIGQARSAKEVSDVDGTRLWIETKHQARVNILAAMRQAVAATDGRPPVVISRCNNSPDLVTMRLEDWMCFFDRLEKLEVLMATKWVEESDYWR